MWFYESDKKNVLHHGASWFAAYNFQNLIHKANPLHCNRDQTGIKYWLEAAQKVE